MNHLWNEEELIQKCIANDKAAMKQFYEQFGSRVYGICMRYLGNRDDAQDLLQEGFIVVFDKLRNYQHGNLSAWISRIIVNMCIDQLRKRKKIGFVDDAELENFPDNDEVLVPEGYSLNKVLDAMNKLPYKYKTVLNLYAIDKLNHKEIANLLGISEGGSKSQLSRARVILKDLLQKGEK